jgi:hypothetical protein
MKYIVILALLLTGCVNGYKCINGKQYIKYYYQDYWEEWSGASNACITDAELAKD